MARRIALIDFNRMDSHAWGFFLGARSLRDVLECELRGFESRTLGEPSFLGQILEFLRFLTRAVALASAERTYLMAGMFGVLRPSVSRSARLQARVRFQDIRPIDLEELQALRVRGVHIGDLIYDDYCKRSRIPSPSLESEHFYRFFEESMLIFEFWESFFESEEVVAVVGQSVYLNAVPLRLATSRGIPALQVGPSRIESYDLENPGFDQLYRWFVPLRRELTTLDDRWEPLFEREHRALLDEIARFSDRPAPLLMVSENGRIDEPTVVIFAHNLYDSSHQWGSHHFPDYFQWLRAALSLSQKSKGRWFLKFHPQGDVDSHDITQSLLAEYPSVRALPISASQEDVLALGTTHVLTVDGTAATEYPPFGITCIACSKSATYAQFSFALIPRDRSHWEEMVLSGVVKTNPSLREIAEWRVLRNYLPSARALFPPLADKDKSPRNFRSLWANSRARHPDALSSDQIREFLELGEHWLMADYAIKVDDGEISVRRFIDDDENLSQSPTTHVASP